MAGRLPLGYFPHIPECRRTGRRADSSLLYSGRRAGEKTDLIMRKQITIRVKVDSVIKVVAEELDNNRGVITRDGCLYKRNEYTYIERVWCHFCRNSDEVAYVNTFFGIRACCSRCKPINCCSVPGCKLAIHSTHVRRGEVYAYCSVHWRKSEFYNPEDDAYLGVSDEGIMESEKLWVQISNKKTYTTEELLQYSQLLENYRT